MAQSALILGGTGQIGYASTLALLEAGWAVTAAHRGRSPLPPEFPAEIVHLDRADSEALGRTARGHDLVVDTVAFTPEHARQLLQLDVGALCVISTGSVYAGANGSYLDIATDDESFPDFPVPIDEDWPTVDNDEQTYSPLKAAMERVLLAGTLPVSILRAGAIHGPYSPGLREWFFIRRALDGRRRVVLSRNGQGRFHPAATANLAALVVACASSPGSHVLNAVDDDCPTEAEIGRAVFDAMGHSAEILTFAGPPLGGLGESPWSVAKPFVLSMDRAHTEVGYRAPVSYRQAVEADVDWAVRTVRASGLSTDRWREIFPGAGNFGADGWFDYEAEDSYEPEGVSSG